MKNNPKWGYTPLCLLDSRDFRACLDNVVKTELQPNWTLERFESSFDGNQDGGDIFFKASYKSADGLSSWATIRGDGYIDRSTSFKDYIYAKDFTRYNYTEELGDVLITCTVVLDAKSVVDPSAPVE